MGAQQDLEKQMDEYLVKKAPFQIPENGRKGLVKYLPVIALVFGIISILAALSLWNTARQADDLIDGLNRLGLSTGYDYGMLYYVALGTLIFQGVLLLMAYKPLNERSKRGWDLLLFGVVVSFIFGIFYLFTDVGSFGNFLGSILGTIIGLYILAQISSHYKASKPSDSKATVAKSEKKK